jgi:hypothetical protein
LYCLKFVHCYWFMLVYALVRAVNYYVIQEDDPRHAAGGL